MVGGDEPNGRRDRCDTDEFEMESDTETEESNDSEPDGENDENAAAGQNYDGRIRRETEGRTIIIIVRLYDRNLLRSRYMP